MAGSIFFFEKNQHAGKLKYPIFASFLDILEGGVNILVRELGGGGVNIYYHFLGWGRGLNFFKNWGRVKTFLKKNGREYFWHLP